MNRRELLKYLVTLPLIKTLVGMSSFTGSTEDKAEDIVADTMQYGYYVGGGTIFFKPKHARGYVELGEVEEFNIHLESDMLEHRSLIDGKLLNDPVIIEQQFTFDGKFKSMNGEG